MRNSYGYDITLTSCEKKKTSNPSKMGQKLDMQVNCKGSKICPDTVIQLSGIWGRNSVGCKNKVLAQIFPAFFLQVHFQRKEEGSVLRKGLKGRYHAIVWARDSVGCIKKSG